MQRYATTLSEVTKRLSYQRSIHAEREAQASDYLVAKLSNRRTVAEIFVVFVESAFPRPKLLKGLNELDCLQPLKTLPGTRADVTCTSQTIERERRVL